MYIELRRSETLSTRRVSLLILWWGRWVPKVGLEMLLLVEVLLDVVLVAM
jgi:hypothetical protein